MSNVSIKQGDSIKWITRYKQPNGDPIDLSSSQIIVTAVKAINTSSVLFRIDSNAPTSNMYITIDSLVSGEFNIIVKDTSSFEKGKYFIDIQYIDDEGFKQSTESIDLTISGRL